MAAAEAWNSAYRILAAIAPTIVVYKLDPDSWAFMGALTVFNLSLIWRCARQKGPLRSGRSGVATEVAHVCLAIGLVGAVLPSGSYFEAEGSLPFSTYAAPLSALLVFWPPVSREATVRIPGTTAALARIAALACAVLACMVLSGVWNGYSLSEISFGTLALQAGWTAVGGLVGLAARRVGEMFSASEIGLVQETYKRFADWLHSDLKGDLLGLHAALVEGEAREQIGRELERVRAKVQDERLRLLMQQDWVAVADVLSHHVRRFQRRVSYSQLPHVGGWTMPNRTAYLFDRTLGDLLSNAAMASVSTIGITLSASTTSYELSIRDDGPGFDDGVMDGFSSLAVLRRDLEGAGGQLVKRDLYPGTEMEAVIPLQYD